MFMNMIDCASYHMTYVVNNLINFICLFFAIYSEKVKYWKGISESMCTWGKELSRDRGQEELRL